MGACKYCGKPVDAEGVVFALSDSGLCVMEEFHWDCDDAKEKEKEKKKQKLANEMKNVQPISFIEVWEMFFKGEL